jgi:hypothetical protein
VLPSCPIVVLPSCCASWLLCGICLMLLPPSNATAAGLYCPPPPLLLLPLPPGCHRHHHGQTHRRPLPKKEATATPPPAYQQQHQCETFPSPDNLDLFHISTVFEVCDAGQGNLAISKLLALKKCTFFAIYILRNDSFYILGKSFLGVRGTWGSTIRTTSVSHLHSLA